MEIKLDSRDRDFYFIVDVLEIMDMYEKGDCNVHSAIYMLNKVTRKYKNRMNFECSLQEFIQDYLDKNAKNLGIINDS